MTRIRLIAMMAALAALAATPAKAKTNNPAQYMAVTAVPVANTMTQQTTAPAEFALSVQNAEYKNVGQTPLQALTTKKPAAEQYADPGGVGIGVSNMKTTNMATLTATVSYLSVNNATTATRASPVAATQNNTKYNLNLGFTSSTKLTRTVAPAEIGGNAGLADVTAVQTTLMAAKPK